jgi:LysM repeat protein
MMRLRFLCLVLVSCTLLAAPAPAQTPANSEAAELAALSKKIDEQNVKIDALSQQILKLQQEVTRAKAGANPALVGVPEETAATPIPAGNGNSHVVTKGETLTSIAKQYHVGIADLQKFNHIENDRKLQIGQTLAIPGAPGSSPVATSPTATPNG